MDTVVTIEVPNESSAGVDARVEAAFRWFGEVERMCSRFDPESELSQLNRRPGERVAVSELLFRVIHFAVQVAADSEGAFDPTLGATMIRAGFDRNYRTGSRVAEVPVSDTSFRDIVLSPASREVNLLRPLALDLGAVAKGLAIDLAARELSIYPNFAINAGGDLFVRGCDATGRAWRIGVRDPRDFESLVATLELDGVAVCTSGDYERSGDDPGTHHILNPRTAKTARESASATVVAPTAMLADAFATAAFVLGPERGIEFLEGQEVEGLILTPTGERFETVGFARFLV